MKRKLGVVLLVLASAACSAMGQAAGSSAPFPPLEQWKAAVISGNATLLKSMYSSNPPAHIMTVAADSSVDADVAFWTGLKARQIKRRKYTPARPAKTTSFTSCRARCGRTRQIPGS
jgi:hypothetical protein